MDVSVWVTVMEENVVYGLAYELNIKREIRKRGRFYSDKLNFIDRNLMKFFGVIFKEDDLIKELVRGLDEVRKENLQELLEHVRGIEAR